MPDKPNVLVPIPKGRPEIYRTSFHPAHPKMISAENAEKKVSIYSMED